MNINHSQKFYCYSCNKETLGIISDVQTSHGINQCIICTNCFNMVSLSLLDKINKKVDELIKEYHKQDLYNNFDLHNIADKHLEKMK